MAEGVFACFQDCLCCSILPHTFNPCLFFPHTQLKMTQTFYCSMDTPTLGYLPQLCDIYQQKEMFKLRLRDVLIKSRARCASGSNNAPLTAGPMGFQSELGGNGKLETERMFPISQKTLLLHSGGLVPLCYLYLSGMSAAFIPFPELNRCAKQRGRNTQKFFSFLGEKKKTRKKMRRRGRARTRAQKHTYRCIYTDTV